MSWLIRFLRRARAPFRRDELQLDINEEFKAHIELEAEERIRAGMNPQEARRTALRDFGGIDRYVEEARSVRGASWLDALTRELRHAVRALARAPGFSAVAVLTLALGIGANAAVFGVVKSALLDALPYADADRLVRVHGRFLDGTDDSMPLSAGTISDIAERQRSFERLASFNTSRPDVVYGDDGGPQIVTAAWVEPGLFRTLGVRTALGRAFNDDDAQDTARVVLLTHGAWQQLFGGDSDVLGRNVRIDRIPRTVIGVLPRDFAGPVGEVDVYFPLDLTSTLRDPIRARRAAWLGLVGRVKPGVTQEVAQRELAAIGADLAREYPEANGGIALAAMPLRDAMVGDTREPLLVLMASAGLVLLITCANLAGALLSRTISRRKEFAVRAALGAGRGRVIRQLLTESALLALAGGAAGLLLAMLGLAAVRDLALPMIPAYADLSLDAGALLVMALVALCTGLAFGVAPALSVGRLDPGAVLRDETRGASEGRRSRHLRGALVAGQIALCISLLAGAGLLARSLLTMTTTPLGIDPNGVLTMAFQLPLRDYPTVEAHARFHEQLSERLRALPGVDAVASASGLPTTVRNWMGFIIEGAPPPNDLEPVVLYASVSDDYFRTLRIPLRRGRTFDAQDHPDAPPTVVISESMARRYWPGGDALGARIRMGPDRNAPLMAVIGIVGDVRNDPARPDAEPMAYRSNRQDPWQTSYLLRTDGDPLVLVRPVERELAALDPELPRDATTLRAHLASGLAARRHPVVLLTAFGGLALLLVSVGVYAMFASMTSAREREFGIRIALGSSRRAIVRSVLRQGAVSLVAGLAGGTLGVIVVARLLRNLLYGVSPFDPVALGAVIAILLLCAMVALFAPVRRATRVDPATALRAQ